MVRFAFLLFAALAGNAVLAQNAPILSTKSKKAIELYTVADNYRVRGEFEQAIDLLNQAIAKDPKFTEAYLRLGITYFSMKQYANALKQFEKGLSLADDLSKQKAFWFAMGEPYLLTGEYEKAMKVLSSFISNERSSKQRLDRANMLYKSAEFALDNKKHPNPYSSRPLSDSVNEFELQYFPVLTADQSLLIYTR